MKVVVFQFLTEPMKMLKKCGIWCIQAVNQTYFVEILEQLREAVSRERPTLWSNDWILHHYCSPAHKVLSVKQFLAQISITEMEHPPYSSDLAPADFCFHKGSFS
jgi:hypothetical protein